MLTRPTFINVALAFSLKQNWAILFMNFYRLSSALLVQYILVECKYVVLY